jgi:hypothetical protein
VTRARRSVIVVIAIPSSVRCHTGVARTSRDGGQDTEGPFRQAPIRSRSPDRCGPSGPSGSADRSIPRQPKRQPVIRGQTESEDPPDTLIHPTREVVDEEPHQSSVPDPVREPTPSQSGSVTQDRPHRPGRCRATSVLVLLEVDHRAEEWNSQQSRCVDDVGDGVAGRESVALHLPRQCGHHHRRGERGAAPTRPA